MFGSLPLPPPPTTGVTIWLPTPPPPLVAFPPSPSYDPSVVPDWLLESAFQVECLSSNARPKSQEVIERRKEKLKERMSQGRAGQYQLIRRFVFGEGRDERDIMTIMGARDGYMNGVSPEELTCLYRAEANY